MKHSETYDEERDPNEAAVAVIDLSESPVAAAAPRAAPQGPPADPPGRGQKRLPEPSSDPPEPIQGGDEVWIDGDSMSDAIKKEIVEEDGGPVEVEVGWSPGARLFKVHEKLAASPESVDVKVLGYSIAYYSMS